MTSMTRDGFVEFRFYRPGARVVTVRVDSNEWGKEALTMSAHQRVGTIA